MMAVQSEFAAAVYILTRDPSSLTDEPTSDREVESGHAVRTLHILMTGAPAPTIAAARAEVRHICEQLLTVLTS
jgi:hypothetical protein